MESCLLVFENLEVCLKFLSFLKCLCCAFATPQIEVRLSSFKLAIENQDAEQTSRALTYLQD